MRLTDDIFESCPMCGGSGRDMTPAKAQSGSFGRQVWGSTGSTCGRCAGKGKVLTETGWAIASVIEHVSRQGR